MSCESTRSKRIDKRSDIVRQKVSEIVSGPHHDVNMAVVNEAIRTFELRTLVGRTSNARHMQRFSQNEPVVEFMI
jgi:hypothetical protein